jgi:hypothetical protein
MEYAHKEPIGAIGPSQPDPVLYHQERVLRCERLVDNARKAALKEIADRVACWSELQEADPVGTARALFNRAQERRNSYLKGWMQRYNELQALDQLFIAV